VRKPTYTGLWTALGWMIHLAIFNANRVLADQVP
jgi:hypothetical protein